MLERIIAFGVVVGLLFGLAAWANDDGEPLLPEPDAQEATDPAPTRVDAPPPAVLQSFAAARGDDRDDDDDEKEDKDEEKREEKKGDKRKGKGRD